MFLICCFLRPSFTVVPVEDLHWYWDEVVLKARPRLDIQPDDKPEVVRKKEDLVRSLNKFLAYLEDTYIGREDSSGTKRLPKLKPIQWNKHEAASNCDAVTTTKAEVSGCFRHL